MFHTRARNTTRIDLTPAHHAATRPTPRMPCNGTPILSLLRINAQIQHTLLFHRKINRICINRLPFRYQDTGGAGESYTSERRGGNVAGSAIVAYGESGGGGCYWEVGPTECVGELDADSGCGDGDVEFLAEG